MVGPDRMRELFYTSGRISAEQMYQLGGISRIVPHESLMDEARGIADEIACKSPPAIRLAKEVLNRGEYIPLKEAYRTEQDYTVTLARHDDSQEAMQALLDHREPRFRGR